LLLRSKSNLSSSFRHSLQPSPHMFISLLSGAILFPPACPDHTRFLDARLISLASFGAMPCLASHGPPPPQEDGTPPPRRNWSKPFRKGRWLQIPSLLQMPALPTPPPSPKEEEKPSTACSGRKRRRGEAPEEEQVTDPNAAAPSAIRYLPTHEPLACALTRARASSRTHARTHAHRPALFLRHIHV
jgi:hypothetical protein